MDANVAKWQLKYRLLPKGIAPRRIALDVPGWAGDRIVARDGATPQPWHCQPFVDGSLYGLELIYPYDTECRVIGKPDGIEFVAGFAHEVIPGMVWPPFRMANPDHYSLGTLIDLEVPSGCALRVEPHPRLFTDRSGTTPIPVIGNLQTSWWPMFFFVTFKAPLAGEVHIFNKGDPYAQVIVVPSRVTYELTPMNNEHAEQREQYARLLMQDRTKIARHSWNSCDNLNFDDLYKQLSRVNIDT